MIQRLRQLFRRRAVKYVSWYRVHDAAAKRYLCSYDYGVLAFFYSEHKKFAHRFDTFEEADAQTPPDWLAGVETVPV